MYLLKFTHILYGRFSYFLWCHREKTADIFGSFSLVERGIIINVNIPKETTTDPCVQFPQAMEINTTVTNLNLSSNRLGLSSCKYLGEMLRQNRCLKNLDLSCNHLEEGGARIIHHEGIKNNTKIRKVHWISESRKPLVIDKGLTLIWRHFSN